MTTGGFLQADSDFSDAWQGVSVLLVESHPHFDRDGQAGKSRSGWRHRLHTFFAHDHDHGQNPSNRDTGAEGIRATKVSLLGLGLTTLFQAFVVILSGSVALLSDTIHNLGDALTAIPLWIAFSLGRRPPTRRYTHGFHRAEDGAGLVILLAIGASAVLIVSESIHRLFEPRLIEHVPWVIVAGLVGAVGNETVARYRIRAGRRIGSEALVADGHHARADAFTSLAVVAAGLGASFGAAWVDPAAGLLVAGVVILLLGKSGKSIVRRLLDGIEPEVVDKAKRVIAHVDGVRGVADLRVRWQGHRLQISASIGVNPDATVNAGHNIAHEVEHELHHSFEGPLIAVIHIDPHGHTQAHEKTEHHH